MPLFDAYLFVDWSGRATPSPRRESPDAIWIGEEPGGTARYFRTRAAAVDYLVSRLSAHLAEGQRVLAGFDFPFGYPAGFAAALGCPPDMAPWAYVWQELSAAIQDAPDNANNRWDAAARLNQRCGPGPGPFWGLPVRVEGDSVLTRFGPGAPHAQLHPPLARKRVCDEAVRGVQEAWKLYGIGSVGSQALLGIPRLVELRQRLQPSGNALIWPFETGLTASPFHGGPGVLLAECWPGTLEAGAEVSDHHGDYPIKDRSQVLALARWAVQEDATGRLATLLSVPSLTPEVRNLVEQEEGWILGAPTPQRAN